MDEFLISEWNKKVGPDDEVRHGGDVAYCCDMEYALSIMKRLNGQKHLIKGNHDKLALAMNAIRPGTWASIKDMDEFSVKDQRIIMCHYPLLTWHHSYKGTWMLYGHVHGTLKNAGKSVDIGVDCWNYAPITFEELKQKMDNLPNAHAIPKGQEWDKTDNVETQN